MGAPPHLDPFNAHETLKELLEGTGEEVRDGESDGAIQRHGDEHAAGRDGVAQHHVHSEGEENYDFAGREVGGHVCGSQHGALHQVDDLLPMVGTGGVETASRLISTVDRMSTHYTLG